MVKLDHEFKQPLVRVANTRRVVVEYMNALVGFAMLRRDPRSKDGGQPISKSGEDEPRFRGMYGNFHVS